MSKTKLIDEYPTTPFKCACCEKCRVIIEGPHAGRCLYGGPYLGYIKMKDYDDNLS